MRFSCPWYAGPRFRRPPVLLPAGPQKGIMMRAVLLPPPGGSVRP